MPRAFHLMSNHKITEFLPSTSASSSSAEGTDTSEYRCRHRKRSYNFESSEDESRQVKQRGKHRSSYNPKWTDEFPWLRYAADHKDGPSMFCTLCQKHNEATKRMVWTSFPCQQFRKDKLLEHQRSKSHMDAVHVEGVALAAKHSGGVRASMEEQVSLQRQAVKGALKCVYWLAKEETAHFTKFPSLLRLAKFLGCSYLHELDVAGNAHYTSNRMIDEFLTILSQSLEKDILSKVQASPVISILCDESTDVANLKQLSIFVRFLVDGKPRTCFLKIVDIINGTAETIEKTLLDVCSECEIPTSLIFSFGSDGAAVMTGRKTGVATRMKSHKPEMVSIHCGAHRVALACSQAAANVDYVKKFDTHLTSLYYFFANSPVREAALHEIQKIMEEPVLRLKMAVHTRWLSHDLAITAIRRTMPALIAALEREIAQNGNAIARGLVFAIKSYKFVATVYLLSDILPHISRLSLVFQKEDVDLSLIKPQVSATIASLKFIRSNPGPFMQELDKVVSDLTSQFGLVVTENAKESYNKNIREKYIDLLVENLENRFSDSSVLSALVTLFNPKKVSDASTFDDYGNLAVDKIAAQYTTTVVKQDLQHEWLGFKHLLIGEVFKDTSPTEVIATIAGDASFSSLYPIISKLASIVLTLPVSTAHVEREFSTMKRIKTDSRNRLKTETLDKLIRLSSEGPTFELFAYDVAVDTWASKCHRRIQI